MFVVMQEHEKIILYVMISSSQKASKSLTKASLTNIRKQVSFF